MFEGKKVKVLLSQAGSGKGVPVTSKILTKNGFIMLKDLKLYDKVISPVDGKEYPVTGIYNRGYRHVNKITFTNRTSVLFDDDHLWAIQSDADRCAGKPFTVVTAEELKNTPLHRQAGKWRKHLVFIPVSCSVEFSDEDLPMPYALGLFTSDGCTVNRRIVIAEEDVKRKFEDDIKECGSYIKPLKKKYNYYLYNFRSFKNKFSFFGTHSYNKFIPKEYLYASLETRRKLLAGLIDGDGTVSSSGKIDFDSTSEQLIEDITFLVSSLGGVVTKRKEKTGKYKKDGNTIICRSVYRITFWLPEGVILSEKHTKRLNSCTKQRRPYKAIESIEDAGFTECMCIYIDSPDHLFITDDWIVTHNTRALMTEIENELKTRRSEEIAFVTYTKKGVEEGVRRACNAMNLAPDDLPYFCTLHALTFRALGYKRDQVFNRIQQNKFNKKYGYNLNVCEVSSRYNVHPTKDTEYFNIYEAIRSGSITSEQYASSEIDMEYLHHFAHDYEEFKAQECLTDFTDCLIHYVQNGVTLPVKVAMVDECFSPETEVRMADGSVKEIKDIKVGDKVQGTKGATTVISKCEGIDDMYNVVAGKNKVLFTCNSRHALISPFSDSWEEAQNLEITKVYFQEFEGEKNPLSVKCRVERTKKSCYVGITVDALDSLFVLANGCVVHNCQDITALQWKVIELAFAKAEKIFIAGDENQCLYTYNGARPDFLINFAKQFPTEYLSISHRIPKQVYYLAKGIVDLIDDKTEKPFDMKKENVNGKIVQIDNFERLLNFIDVDNLDDKKETEWYIICRNNCYLEEPKDILEENLIPYWTSDGFFMDGEILRRIKDYYNFGLKGYKTEKKKKEFAERFNIVDFNLPFTESNLFTEHKKFIYYNFVECYGLEKLEEMCKWNPQILVSSIHHVKGGEARNVALLLDTTRKVDINLYNKIDEELRVLYVAVTRTKENLILIDSSHGEGYGKIIETVKEENGLEW